MINLIWCAFIMVSVLCSILGNKADETVNALYNSIEASLKLSFTMLGVMSFWSGISRMCERNGISQKLSSLLYPILKKLFPKNSGDKETMSAVSMNLISNMLGLSNAATPLGIKAIKRMGERQNTIDSEMILFVVINTCSLQLIPTSISALRVNYGSSEPFSILPHIWIVSFCTLITAIFLCSLFSRLSKRKGS